MNLNQKKKPGLSVLIELLRLETYLGGECEGWIEYQLTLLEGTSIIAKTQGTIHDADVTALCKFLASQEEGIFEPLEPDFEVRLSTFDDKEMEFICFADSRITNTDYDCSGIGIKLIIEKRELRRFADALSKEQNSLTGGKRYSLD